MQAHDVLSGVSIPEIHNAFHCLIGAYGQLLAEQARQIQFLQAQLQQQEATATFLKRQLDELSSAHDSKDKPGSPGTQRIREAPVR